MVWSIQLKPGSSFILAGPTMAGKTTFVCSLLRYRTFMFGCFFKRIIVFTPHAQSKYEKLRNEGIVNEIYNEIPTLEDLDKIASAYMDCGGCIIVLDDIMSGWNVGLNLDKVFTELCHHKNVTCILLVQNLFFQNTEYRVMGLNSTYLCAFKNPRDLRQISTLGAKMIPGKGKFIVEAFQRATKNPWSYLFLDYNQDCPDVVRMRSNILPNDKDPEDIFFLNTNNYY